MRMNLLNINVNNYLNHVWVVNLDDVKRSIVDDVVGSLNNQGCVTIVIQIQDDFLDIYERFRSVISQISSCALILIVLLYDKKTNAELLTNTLGYMRCCQMCILYTGGTIPDASLVSTKEILDMVGGLSIKFGEDDMDDISFNSGSISNSLRFNCISWANHLSMLRRSQGIIYVGWHLLSYIYGLELGINMIVYEMHGFEDPVQLCKTKIRSIKPSKGQGGKNPGYNRPNAKVKLGALFSWALIEYDSIIVIGGYPCKELRRMYKFINQYSKQVVLIDPAFNGSSTYDSVTIIKGEWDFSIDVDQNLLKLNIRILHKKCLVIDDSWVSQDKWKNLKNKLNTLKPKRSMDVSIKFNWYNDSNESSVWIDNLHYMMLTPGVNDSTESRMLLSYGAYGHLMDKKEYLNIMGIWKQYTMAEQCFMFGYYFKKVIKCTNILNESISDLSKYIVISLYALGNVCSNMHIDILKEWSDNDVYYILNLYTDLNNDGSTVLYKGYRDVIYRYVDILKLYNYNVYSLTVDKLYNILYVEGLRRKGFKIMGDLHNIKDTVCESNKRILLTNFRLPDDVKYQSSLFSFASRLKWITIKLRVNREIGMNTTYLIRYNIMARYFGLDVVQYDPKAHSLLLDVSKCRNKVLSVLSNKRRIYLQEFLNEVDVDKYNIEVSGHVLNLMMWEVLEPGSLLLWIKQIIFYYNNIANDTLGHKRNEERKRLLLQLWRRGYFMETSLNRLDKKWHTKLEMLLACAIATEYWGNLINISIKHMIILNDMSLTLFDIFTEHIIR